MTTTGPLPLPQRIARGLVVVALCLSLGLQWAALQGIAWTGMLINYTTEGTLAEAVVKTFDGEHPCALCQLVEEGRGKQKPLQGSDTKITGKKLDALLVTMPVVIPPAGQARLFFEWNRHAQARPQQPAEEPPRAQPV
jgi:hypothetical protein